MAFSVQSKKSGNTYYLHSKETEVRGGMRLLYFFKREVVNDGGFRSLDAMPAGYSVIESEKTGLPLPTKRKA